MINSFTIENLVRIEFTKQIFKLDEKLQKHKITEQQHQQQKQQWFKLCFYGYTNLAISNYNKLKCHFILNRSYFKVYIRTEVLVITNTDRVVNTDAFQFISSSDTLVKSAYRDLLDNHDYYEVSPYSSYDDIKFLLGIVKLNKFTEICNNLKKTKDIMVKVHVYAQEALESPVLNIGSYESVKFICYSRPTKTHFLHPSSESPQSR